MRYALLHEAGEMSKELVGGCVPQRARSAVEMTERCSRFAEVFRDSGTDLPVELDVRAVAEPRPARVR